ncbi:Histidine--tRNA ligase [Phycisphaerae bacterium RAS1]|nr:Histidine--tRNA ligase [Phycisphaerae bacterium RAS1]
MKIQTPPGMRDFYPADMRLQTWLLDQWRSVSRCFGFEEYEGPIFESLDLYKIKSGEGIVSELFNFTDRGERQFAIRPEMTPTLARMVAARAGALPRPIKWFSLPRMCRAEKPQRGRLREFFQWNVDTIGSDDPLCDAEVIAAAVEFLRRCGLSGDDVVVELNSRPIAAARLESLGVAAGGLTQAFDLLDRHEKLGAEEFARQWNAAFAAGGAPVERIEPEFLRDAARPIGIEEFASATEGDESPGSSGESLDAARRAFRELWAGLGRLGVAEYCRISPKLARGLAYYTGAVFEIRDRRRRFRAIAGGGRYDSLVSLLGGPQLSGVGFGMGDAVILELLKDLGKLPELADQLDVFFIDADESLFPTVLELASHARRAGLRADFSLKRQALGKQFKQADGRGAALAVVVGSEYAEGRLTVKRLKTGEQWSMAVEQFRDNPRSAMGLAGGQLAT